MAIPDKSIMGYLVADAKWKQRTMAALGIAATGAAPAAHAASHTDGSDDIQDAGAAQKGLMTAIAQTFAGVKRFNDRVGIGIAPATPLHVLGTSTFHGNGAASLVWGNTTNLGALSYSGNNVIIRSIITDADLIFQRNNTVEAMRIDGSTGDLEFALAAPDGLTPAIRIYGFPAGESLQQVTLTHPSAKVFQLVRTTDVDVLKFDGGRIAGTTRIDDGDSPYAVLASDRVIFCDTDGGAITVNLPAGVEGTHYKIINCGSSANDLTVDPNGTEQLEGAGAGVAKAVTDGLKIDIHYNATEGWW